jgi:hypothetical protein
MLQTHTLRICTRNTVLLAFPWQKYLDEGASTLRYTYVLSLFLTSDVPIHTLP